MLVDLTVKEFLNKVAGSDPVPGGGSIAALNGAVASVLAAMVANLTIGKKNYEEHEELMNHIASLALSEKDVFVADIDRDSEAYDAVFACFKMPKATDEEKAARSASIQEATKYAALVPMQMNSKEKPMCWNAWLVTVKKKYWMLLTKNYEYEKRLSCRVR